MGLFKRKPQWKKRSFLDRCHAINELEDKEILRTLAETDPVWMVRSKAYSKLGDNQKSYELSVIFDRNTKERLKNIAKLENQELLSSLVLNQREPENIRIAALRRLNRQDILLQFVTDKNVDPYWCRTALINLHDQVVLNQIIYDCSRPFEVRMNALQNISDLEQLKQIARDFPELRRDSLYRIGYHFSKEIERKDGVISDEIFEEFVKDESWEIRCLCFHILGHLVKHLRKRQFMKLTTLRCIMPLSR